MEDDDMNEQDSDFGPDAEHFDPEADLEGRHLIEEGEFDREHKTRPLIIAADLLRLLGDRWSWVESVTVRFGDTTVNYSPDRPGAGITFTDNTTGHTDTLEERFRVDPDKEPPES